MKVSSIIAAANRSQQAQSEGARSAAGAVQRAQCGNSSPKSEALRREGPDDSLGRRQDNSPIDEMEAANASDANFLAAELGSFLGERDSFRLLAVDSHWRDTLQLKLHGVGNFVFERMIRHFTRIGKPHDVGRVILDLASRAKRLQKIEARVQDDWPEEARHAVLQLIIAHAPYLRNLTFLNHRNKSMKAESAPLPEAVFHPMERLEMDANTIELLQKCTFRQVHDLHLQMTTDNLIMGIESVPEWHPDVTGTDELKPLKSEKAKELRAMMVPMFPSVRRLYSAGDILIPYKQLDPSEPGSAQEAAASVASASESSLEVVTLDLKAFKFRRYEGERQTGMRCLRLPPSVRELRTVGTYLRGNTRAWAYFSEVLTNHPNLQLLHVCCRDGRSGVHAESAFQNLFEKHPGRVLVTFPDVHIQLSYASSGPVEDPSRCWEGSIAPLLKRFFGPQKPELEELAARAIESEWPQGWMAGQGSVNACTIDIGRPMDIPPECTQLLLPGLEEITCRMATTNNAPTEEPDSDSEGGSEPADQAAPEEPDLDLPATFMPAGVVTPSLREVQWQFAATSTVRVTLRATLGKSPREPNQAADRHPTGPVTDFLLHPGRQLTNFYLQCTGTVDAGLLVGLVDRYLDVFTRLTTFTLTVDHSALAQLPLLAEVFQFGSAIVNLTVPRSADEAVLQEIARLIPNAHVRGRYA